MNLQVANVVVNYDLPWNPMIVEQRIGRVQRLAAKHASVHVLNLVVAGSVEERVVGRLSEKLQGVAQSLGDIESILESAGGGLDDEEGFESLIRKMVLESLRGQDVEASLRRAAESIERGKRIFEQEKENVEQQLGRLDAMHRSGPMLPTITPLKPSIKAEEFVVRALRAEGATVERDELDPTLLTVRRPGRPDETITFDEAAAREAERAQRQAFNPVYAGAPPRLYQPGRPAFERLAQSWSEREAALVGDLGAGDERSWSEIIGQWLNQVEGAMLEAVTLISTRECFQGEVTTRAAAAVSHDRFERLITASARPEGHAEIPPGTIEQGQVIQEELDAAAVLSPARNAVLDQISRDPELGGFRQFYDARLEEEIRLSEADQRARQELRNRFETTITGEIVSIRGAQYAAATVEAKIALDDGEPVTERFELLSATGQLLSAPALVKCDHSGRLAPAACFAQCELSGRRVLRHLLATSERSGRMALPEFMRRCEISGLSLLQDEVVKLDTDGRMVDTTLLGKSAISGRKGLKDNLVTCEFTGDLVFPDEIETSQLSGRRFRFDQSEKSVASGTMGHRSEFVQSEDPRGLVSLVEAGRSSVSGRVCHKDRLVPSEMDPRRLGLPDEAIRCEVTGRMLLVDEVAKSEVSGCVAGRDVLVPSAMSGKLALPEELVACELTGAKGLPGELGRCTVSGKKVDLRLLVRSELSGRAALSEFMVKSAVSGRMLLESEASKSDCSGSYCEPGSIYMSEKSGRKGLEGEVVICEETKKLLLVDEVGVCEETHKHVDRDLLAASERSGRTVLRRFAVRCEESGRLLARDETSLSAVSGKRVDKTLLVRSDHSGSPALPAEMLECESTGRRLLPDEVAKCSVSGRTVDRGILMRSELSDRLALPQFVRKCEVTGRQAIQDELEQCAVTGKWVCRDQLGTCAITARRIRKDHLRSAPGSDREFFWDARSEQTLRNQGLEEPLLRRCCWYGIELPVTELGLCRLSGLPFVKSKLNMNGELSMYRNILDRTQRIPEVSNLDPAAERWIREQVRHLGKLEAHQATRGPAKDYVFVVLQVSGGLLGLRSKTVGAVVHIASPPQLVGELLVGSRRHGGWEADR